jgi:hypothetical protein
VKFQPVAKAERQKLTQRTQEVQQYRDQRRTLEVKAVTTPARRPGAVLEPTKAQLPKSPIAARPVNKLAKNQAPPAVQRAPKPDLKLQPKAEPSGRQPSVERSNPQLEPRKADSEKKSPPGRSEAEPRAMKAAPATQQPQASKPVVTAAAPEAPAPQKLKTENQRSQPVSSPAKARPEAAQAATIKEPAGQNSGEFVGQPPKLAPASQSKAQRVPAVRAKHEQIASGQGRLNPNKGQNQKVTAQQTPRAEPQGNHPAAAKEPAQQISNKQPVKQAKAAQPSDKKVPQVSEKPAREKPAASENNGPNTADKSHENKGKD